MGAQTTVLGAASGIAFGTATSSPTTMNVACPSTGTNTETMPTLLTNGDGGHYWITNISSGTCTFSGSQQFVGAGSGPASNLVIPANTSYEVWSVSIGGTLYWAYK